MRITMQQAQHLAELFADVISVTSGIQDLLEDLQDDELRGGERDDVGDQLTNDLDDLVSTVRAFAGALGLEI